MGRCFFIELCKKGDFVYLQSRLLRESGLVDHAFSTVRKASAGGSVDFVNMAFHSEERVEDVLVNRRDFFSFFGYDFQEIVAAIQVHGTDQLHVDRTQSGEGALPGSFRREGDGLITSDPGLALSAYAADCLLLYFVSSGQSLAAIAHSGRQGSLGNMAGKMVGILEDKYKQAPGDLLVAFSPAICRKCYTIDRQSAAAFIEAGFGGIEFMEERDDGLFELDLKAINREQLVRAGVRLENVDYDDYCTSCRPDLFFSYRREQGKTGRMLGFIAIKDAQGEVNLER